MTANRQRVPRAEHHTALIGKRTKTHGIGRRCESCERPLSRYNPQPQCSACLHHKTEETPRG